MPANTAVLPGMSGVFYSLCVCLFMGFSSIFVVCNLIFIDEKKNWKIKVYTHSFVRSAASSHVHTFLLAIECGKIVCFVCLCVRAFVRDTYVDACVALNTVRNVCVCARLKRKTNVLGLCDGPMCWGTLFNTCQCTMPYTHAYTAYAYIIPRLIPVFSADFSLSLWPSVALLFGPMHRHVNWTMIFIFVRKEKSFSLIFTECTALAHHLCNCNAHRNQKIFCSNGSCVRRLQPASDHSVSLWLWHSHLLSRAALFHLLLTIFLWDFYELHHFAYVNSSMPAIFFLCACVQMRCCRPHEWWWKPFNFRNGSVRNWNHRTSISFTTRNRNEMKRAHTRECKRIEVMKWIENAVNLRCAVHTYIECDVYCNVPDGLCVCFLSFFLVGFCSILCDFFPSW